MDIKSRGEVHLSIANQIEYCGMYIFCPVRGVIMLVNGQFNSYILWGLVKTAARGLRKRILNRRFATF